MPIKTPIPLLLFCLFLTLSCSNEMKYLEDTYLEEKPGIERGKNVEILYSDSIATRVRITAPTLLNFIQIQQPKRQFPDGIVVDCYDNNYVQSSRIRANFAEHIEKEQKVYLRDSVVVWNNQNQKLITDELIWDELNEEVYSNKKVSIYTPTQTIHGKGFHSNLEFTDYELQEIHGIIQQTNLLDNPIGK